MTVPIVPTNDTTRSIVVLRGKKCLFQKSMTIFLNPIELLLFPTIQAYKLSSFEIKKV